MRYRGLTWSLDTFVFAYDAFSRRRDSMIESAGTRVTVLGERNAPYVSGRISADKRPGLVWSPRMSPSSEMYTHPISRWSWVRSCRDDRYHRSTIILVVFQRFENPKISCIPTCRFSKNRGKSSSDNIEDSEDSRDSNFEIKSFRERDRMFRC